MFTQDAKMDFLSQYESNGCLHELFKAQAARTPKKTAVVFQGRCITYEELDLKTDLLAVKLCSLGAQVDTAVGIYMEKCIEYVISYIAILKAGAAYMPLDVTYPAHLLLDIFEDATPVCVLTSSQWQSRIADVANGKQKIFTLWDGWEEEVSQEPLKPAAGKVNLDNLAYICYSSGTTGKPKGIMCPHRGAVFSYTWRHVAYPFVDDDRIACNIFFVWEMLRPLLKGVTMYIIPDDVIYDPCLLVHFMKDNLITRVLFTPSLLETVLDTEGVNLNDLKTLRVIWFCGEVVTTSLLRRCMHSLSWVKFLNLYSISECHDVAASNLSQFWTSAMTNSDDLKKRKFAPVGKVLPGVNIAVLNENMDEQPAGVPGEIFVGGPTLARQYLNRPKLNKERFIEIKRGTGKVRLYRTGDWGLVLSNRDLEICGRCDSMVKIRGFSVETQAVETAILLTGKAKACVVLTDGEEGTDKQLVAYIVPKKDVTKREIRTQLKLKLPNYMIPAHVVFLKRIPVHAATGKLNRKALPPIALNQEQEDEEKGDRPNTETEKYMTKLWSEILQFQVTDTEESFFDLGGHSLLAARLLGKMREIYGLEIDVKSLFAKPTIRELSELVDARMEDSSSFAAERKINLDDEVKMNAIPNFNLDIQLRAFWRSANYDHRWTRGRVLLTGATGFVGAYILRDLLTMTKTNVYCLVRKNKNVKAIERLRKTMQFYEFFSGANEKLQESFEKRVYAITGDVALLELGMDEEDYAHLTHEIDFVIHAAAYVNLVYPYNALKGANVYGTRNVLQFCAVGKIKVLHYVSTNGVFPKDEVNCKEVSSEGLFDRLENGYSRSKWVAEQLVMTALRNGLPTIIYRLGNASGDSENAGWNPSDFTLLMLRASCSAGVWPNFDWQIEMTPVDFISKVIVQMSQNFKLSKHKIFHLINPTRISSRAVYDIMVAEGYKLTEAPFEEWCERVESSNETTFAEGHPSSKNMLAAVTNSKDTSLFCDETTFDQTVFNKVWRVISGIDYPVINRQLMRKYLKNLSRRNVIAKPLTTGKSLLEGKIALVTGASSGIGRAVAESLALAGAEVCVAARRLDRLLEVAQTIKRSGGIARAYQLDVTNKQQFHDVSKRIADECGHIDILVNNAGLMYYTHVHNFMEDDWDRMINVNCRGVTNSLGAILPGMIARRCGHIINTSSDAGRRGFAGLAVYSGTKFFVEGLSQALRHEVKDKGIRVTCIQPGDVKTELLTHTNDYDAKAIYDGSEYCRILDPEDIGRAVVYAVSQPNHVAVNEILIEPRESPI